MKTMLAEFEALISGVVVGGLRQSCLVISCSAVLLGRPSVALPQSATPEAFVVRHAQLDLTVDYSTTRLSGAMTLELENWTARPASSVSFILHRLMEASRVVNGKSAPLRFTQDVRRFRDDPIRQVTQIVVQLPHSIAPGARTTVRIDYAGYLTPYTEIGWLYVRDHVDTTFTLIRSDALAYPVIGGLEDKANRKSPDVDFTYDVSIRVPPKYLVATGGVATRTPNPDGTTTWRYKLEKPSGVLNISIAPFDTIAERGVRIFHFRQDSVGARRVMASTQRALGTLAQWFGPLHSEVNLVVTEIPDGWGSQASLTGGIIQSAAAFRDPGRLGELYHELSHLWNAPILDHPSPRWDEGLASFLEDLLRERIDGWTKRDASDSAWIAWTQKTVQSDSSLRNAPFIDYGTREMTGRSYTVGNLMFASLFQLLGEQEFGAVVGGFYQQFPKGGTTRDFVAFASKASSRSLTAFFDDWMFTTRWTKVLDAARSIGDVAEHYRAMVR